jgi:hypothetical protein
MSTAATVIETTINSQIEVFAEQFNAAAKKTVRSTLAAAKIVLTARNALVLQAAKKSNYLLFLEKIAMNESDADKLCVIAKQEARVEDFLSLAPTVDLKQSALYELAQLSDSDYETNIKSKFVIDVTAVNNVITFTAKTIASANTEKVAKKEEQAAKKKIAESNNVVPLFDDKQDAESKTVLPSVDDKQDAESKTILPSVDDKQVSYVLNVSNLSQEKRIALYKKLELLAQEFDFKIAA